MRTINFIKKIAVVLLLLTSLSCSKQFKYNESNTVEMRNGSVSLRIPKDWQMVRDSQEALKKIDNKSYIYASNNIQTSYMFINEKDDVDVTIAPEGQIVLILDNKPGKIDSTKEKIESEFMNNEYDPNIGAHITDSFEWCGDKLYIKQDIHEYKDVQYQYWDYDNTKKAVILKVFTPDKKITPTLEYILSTIKLD